MSLPLYSCIYWPPEPSKNGEHPSLRERLKNTDRFLGINKKSEEAAFIRVADPGARIRLVSVKMVTRMLKEGKAKEVDYTPERIPMTPAGIDRRERAWKALVTFREKDQSYLFDCHKFKIKVDQAASLGLLSHSNVRIWHRRMLQAGMDKEGMTCLLAKCGRMKGEARFVEKGKKRGRKKKNADKRRKTLDETLSPRDREILDEVIEKCLCGNPNRQVNYEDAWEFQLPAYYNDGLGDGDPNKRMMPSKAQFLRHIEKTDWKTKIPESRQTRAGLDSKGKPQNSGDTSIDPTTIGEVYQIDSTRADIWLVLSERDRRVVGKPTVYLVVDVASSMICGVHVTLGAPSYYEATRALVSVLKDKVELCKEYGITIEPHQWPNTPLPGMIVADRQEFISLNSRFPGERLNIEIVNAIKYSGWYKGMIESRIGTTMKCTWSYPGADDPEASKDERPAFLDSTLTLKIFTAQLLREIIKINGKPNPSFPLPEGTFDQDIEMTPRGIVTWATENNLGMGRQGNMELATKLLFPELTTCSTCVHGIRASIHGVCEIYYDVGTNLDASYLQGAVTPLTGQYDVASMNEIHVLHPETGKIFIAPLYKISRQYRNLSWEEGAQLQSRRKDKLHAGEIDRGKERRDLHNGGQDDIDHAKDCALKQPPMPRAEVRKDQTENRRKARSVELSNRRIEVKTSHKYRPRYEG